MINKIKQKDSRKSGIYIIRNAQDRRVYIGSAVILIRRYKKHLERFERGTNNKKLQSFHNTYGTDDLRFQLLELVDDINDLVTREQFYIDKYKSYKKGFNTFSKADSTLGCVMPESHKLKTSKRMKNNTCRTGSHHSAESKKAIGDKIRAFWANNPSKKKQMAINVSRTKTRTKSRTGE